ncbi:MAG: DUF445 family protein [Spirochaetes bacterium]|nr:DUF445 family protein [Spirochaetota bacterium]MBU0955946.1 DUF445 family protein [Spirochaetota bacterium]
MDNIILLILPPLVGAVIGLFTNWLAIKMLFRPRYEKRIFGHRLPFTPGILPRERQRLAASLGDTAAGDLLTEEVLSTRIMSAEFRQSLRSAVLDGEHALLDSTLKDAGAGASTLLPGLIQQTLRNSVQSLGQSAAFQAAATKALQTAIDELDQLPLSSLVNQNTLGSLSGALLTDEACQRVSSALVHALDAQLEKAIIAGACPADFIKIDQIPAVSEQLLRFLWPFMAEKVVEILGQQRLRRNLEVTGAVLVRRIIEKLNSVQRFFVGLGGYERSILESMPEIIDDFTITVQRLLQRDETFNDVLVWLQETLVQFMTTPLAQHRLLAGAAKREELLQKTEHALTTVLRSIDSKKLVETLATRAENQPLGVVFSFFPQLQQVLAASAGAWLSSLFQTNSDSSRSASRMLSVFFETYLEQAENRPLADLLAIDSDKMSELADFASEAVARLAAAQSARIIKSIDVRTMVQDRINALEIEQVERMILRVMDRELKAVTWFGALLGGLMGLTQTLINLLR